MSSVPERIADFKSVQKSGQRARTREQAASWRLFLTFLAQTGLRIGEAVELRWRDVDLGQGTVQVRRRFYRREMRPADVRPRRARESS